MALTRPHRKGKAMRRVTPIRPPEPDAVPVNLGAAQQLIEAQRKGFLIVHSQQPEPLGN